MNLQKFDMGRGITLCVIHTDKFKSCYTSVAFNLPLQKQTAAANTLVGCVLSRACKKYPTVAARTAALQELYDAQISPIRRQRGEVQQIGFVADTVDDRCLPGDTSVFSQTLGILRELLFAPLTDENGKEFDGDTVEKEKKNLADDIRSIINNKTSYASFRLRSEMCAGEAYGVSLGGSVEDIMAQTPRSLYLRYREIIRTAPVQVFFVGNTDGLDLRASVEKLFEGVERDCAKMPKTSVVRRAERVREVTEEQPSSQGKLCMGFRCDSVMGEEDYPAMVVANEVYGGSLTSKLFTNVREKLSLCYYCRSVFDTLKGIMIVSSGIDNSNRDAAQNEILAQLDAVRRGEITEDEMLSAKKGLVNTIRESYDSPFAQDGFYSGRLLSGIEQSPEQFIESIMAVSAEQVAQAANKLTLDTVYFLCGVGGGCEEESDED